MNHSPHQFKLDLDQATAVELPPLEDHLAPGSFRTADGRDGWAVRFPGRRPITTPAYADGLLFVGGGYGSHEFYAFDATTGAMRWKITTTDDGPTAAVVEEGRVAFNTESCTVVVVEAATGRLLWEEWLGDPLMSQPAIADHRLFIGFPASARSPKVTRGHSEVDAHGAGPSAEEGAWRHRLMCADLETGKHHWVRPIPAAIITAPVIEGGHVYLTCFDGTSMCLDAKDGRILSQEQNAATSAPIVAAGKYIVTRKRVQGRHTSEDLLIDAGLAKPFRAGAAAEGRGAPHTVVAVQTLAEYLTVGSKPSTPISGEYAKSLDASVGFGGMPANASGSQVDHLNVQSVSGGWAYQGSRAAYRGGSILNAQGSSVNCVEADDGKVRWQAETSGRGVDADAQVFAPPALGEGNAYLCSGQGHVVSLRQSDGGQVFAYAFGRLMGFQPALAEGNVYLGTLDGLLICLKTGDRDASGWHAWGGNAQHNKSK